ncbi:MAG: carbon monoxide dehydrogenase subunit G [Candidatus Korobacteraceae bacterium]
MAINFSGEFTTPRAPEEVFDFLSDPNRFGPLLPDFQSMTMQDPTHFTVKVKVGVGNIRGSADLKMELSEAVKPLRAHYKGQGTAVGSQVTVSAGFDLSALPEGTKVVWQGETSIFGKLASMAGGMLEPLGRKNIQKLIEGLQQALSVPTTVPPIQAATSPVTRSDNVGVPQSRTPIGADAAEPEAAPASPVEPAAFSSANANASDDTTPKPVAAQGYSPANTNPSDVATLKPVEEPGFSRTNNDPSDKGASAPAQEHGEDIAHTNR